MRIMKKREEAKGTPFVVGGVYLHKETDEYVILSQSDFDQRFQTVMLDGGGTLHTNFTEEAQRGVINDQYVYIPHARLVIDENEEVPHSSADGLREAKES